MDRPVKIKGDMKYLSIIVPSMLERIEKGGGSDISHAKNHHTTVFEFNTGERVLANTYETKTMIVIEWREE